MSPFVRLKRRILIDGGHRFRISASNSEVIFTMSDGWRSAMVHLVSKSQLLRYSSIRTLFPAVRNGTRLPMATEPSSPMPKASRTALIESHNGHCDIASGNATSRHALYASSERSSRSRRSDKKIPYPTMVFWKKSLMNHRPGFSPRAGFLPARNIYQSE